MTRGELEAVCRYLDIEQVRFGDRLVVSTNVPDTLADEMVPSFLLQPLVENAVRHGFVDSTRPLHIDVSATGAAGGILTIRIGDDGAGMSAESNDGVGLANTRARLQGLYGDGASLTLTPGDRGVGTVVTVVLPPQTASARAQV